MLSQIILVLLKSMLIKNHVCNISAAAPARPTAPKPGGGGPSSSPDLPPEVAALAAYAG